MVVVADKTPDQHHHLVVAGMVMIGRVTVAAMRMNDEGHTHTRRIHDHHLQVDDANRTLEVEKSTHFGMKNTRLDITIDVLHIMIQFVHSPTEDPTTGRICNQADGKILPKTRRLKGNGNLRLCNKMPRPWTRIARNGWLLWQSKKRPIVKRRIRHELGRQNMGIGQISLMACIGK